MIDKGSCNYCRYEAVKRVAKAAGAEVVVEKAKGRGNGAPDGLDTAYPNGVDVSIHYKGDAEPTWAMWLAELPGKCAC